MNMVKCIMFVVAILAFALFLTACGPTESLVNGPKGIQGDTGATGPQGEVGDQGATGVAGQDGAPATSPVMLNLCPSSKKPRYGLCANGALSAAYAIKGVYFTPLAVGKHTVGTGANKCVFTVVSGCQLL